jgi:hypothetical protein
MTENEKEYQRKYRLANKEKKLEYNRRYYLLNKEIFIAKASEWQNNNKEKKREYNRKHQHNNLAAARKRSRKYYVNNKEKELARCKAYVIKNADKVSARNIKYKQAHATETYAARKENWGKYLEYQKMWKRNKIKNDPSYRLHSNTSRHLRTYLTRNNIKKLRVKTFDVLGYTPNDLKTHIEGMFNNGMSWNNYGKHWEIDHKIPLCALKTKEIGDDNFKKAWSLDNLRPLLKAENRAKGGKHVWFISS